MSAQHVQHKLEVWDRTSLKAWCMAGRQTVAECRVEYRDGDGKVNGCNQQKDIAESNARRLAAAWNACEGIETERLEDLGRPLRLHLFGADERAARMVKEQAELLEQLKNAVAMLCARGARDADTDGMRAAIAKATGSAS